jgi:hypothetical protein
LQHKCEKNFVKEKILSCKEKLEKNFNTELNIFKKKIDEINSRLNTFIIAQANKYQICQLKLKKVKKRLFGIFKNAIK